MMSLSPLRENEESNVVDSVPAGPSAPSFEDEYNPFKHHLASCVSSALGTEVSQVFTEGMQSAQHMDLGCIL